MQGGEVVVNFKGNTSNLDGAIKKIQDKMITLGNKMSVLGAKMSLAITAPLVKVGKEALKEAGDLEQSLGGAEAVYKDYYSAIVEEAKKSSKLMGTSTNKYLEYANKIGSLMQGSGLTTEKAYELTTKAMQRASDVASIMGISVEDAMNAITGAAKGNFTMMDNLGVAMNATSLEAYALSKGIKTSYREMSQAEKVALAYNMFLEQTADYAGNYAKENDTLNGSLTTLKAEFENLKAELGKELIPIMTKLTKKIQGLINWWNSLDSGTKKIITTFLKFIAIAGPLLIIVGKIIVAVQTIIPIITTLTPLVIGLKTAVSLLNATLLANPILILVGVIIVLIGVLVLLWTKCEWFREEVKRLFQELKLKFEKAKLYIQLFVLKIEMFFKNLPDKIRRKGKEIIDGFKNGIQEKWEAFKEWLGKKVDKIISMFNIFDKMVQAGKDIIDGLKKGIKDKWESFKGWVGKKAEDIKGFFTNPFGIHSPSTFMRDMVGKNLVLGMQVGYNDTLPDFKKNIQKSVDSMVNISPSTLGGMNNNFSRNINVVNNISYKTDPLGQVVSRVKTYAGGAKNDYNYGYGG